MANYYVDYVAGNDSNSGELNYPVQHISVMIGKLTLPLTEDTTIKLAGSLETPEAYHYNDEVDSEISLINFTSAPRDNYKLMIVPSLFNNSNYVQGKDPFPTSNAPTSFNILAQVFPCTVPPFDIRSSNNIVLMGLDIVTGDEEDDILIQVEMSKGVEIQYCKMTGGSLGIAVNDFSRVGVHNVYLKDNTAGLVSAGHTMVTLGGENFLHDSLKAGVWCALNSSVVQAAMEDCPTKCVTEIRTTAPLDNYSAVLLSDGSLYRILTKYLTEGELPLCYLKIINENAFKGKTYYGVSLESLSSFTGTDQTTFADKDVNQGNDTVPADNQFSSNSNEGCVTKK